MNVNLRFTLHDNRQVDVERELGKVELAEQGRQKLEHRNRALEDKVF